MRKSIAILLFLMVTTPLTAQTLNQDADGKSSVLYQGGAVGFDLTKTRLTFNYTNLALSESSDTAGSYKVVWGINAQGANKDNTANLFTRGDFLPEARLDGILGVRYRLDQIPAQVSVINTELKKIANESRSVTDSLEKYATKIDSTKVAELRARKEQYEKDSDRLLAEWERINKTRLRQVILVYARAERSASTFKLSQANPDTSGLSKVFTNEPFLGGFYSIGANYERGQYLVGTSLEYEYTNNFDLLTKESYTLTTKEVKGNQTLESTKDITAYTGNYSTYKRINLNVDFIWFTLLAERQYVAWNIYLRYHSSQSTSVVPSYTDLGIGAYFFNKDNKFLGGVYLEAPDFNQNLEGAKKNPAYRNLENRLTFGVVARFNFSSIISPSY